MSDLAGFFTIAPNDEFYFSGTSNNDVLLYPETEQQRLHLGTKQGSNAVLVLSSNAININGDINITKDLIKFANEPSSGPTGIMIQRNSNYYLVYDESHQTFQMGLSNSLKTLVTRNSNLVSGYAYYDALTSNLSNRNITADDVPNLSSNLAFSSNTSFAASNKAFSTIGFSNNAQNLFTLSNVGIGASNPIYSLDVFGGARIAMNKPRWNHIPIEQNATINSVITDSQGNIYVGGTYSSPAPIVYNVNYSSSTVTLRSPTNNSGFVVKYNPRGFALWSATIDNTGNESVVNLATDQTGNVYVGGDHTSMPIVYNSTGLVSSFSMSNSTRGFYTVKFNSEGISQWGIYGSTTDSSQKGHQNLKSVVVDSNLNVYVAISFGNPWPFYAYSHTIFNSDNTAYTGLSTNGTNSSGFCVLKFNSNGIGTSVIQIPGNADVPSAIISNMALSPSQEFLGVCGTTWTGVNFGNGVAVRTPTGTQAFLIRLNSNLVAQWVASIDGSANDVGHMVTFDNNNNLYYSGLYNGSISVYNSNNQVTALTTQSGTSNAGFVACVNPAGTTQWISSINAPINYMMTSFDRTTNSLYVAGHNSSNGLIYNAGNVSSGISLRSPSNVGVFLARYNASGIIQSTIMVDTPNVDTSTCLFANNDAVFLGTHATTSSVMNVVENGSNILLTIPAPTITNSQRSVLISYFMTNALNLMGDMTLLGKSYQTNLDVTSNASISGNMYLRGLLAASNQIAIGKSNANYSLDVVGDINMTGALRKNGTLVTTTQWSNSNNIIYVLNSNVSIGTSNAVTGFTSAYDATFNSNVTINGQLTVNNVQYVTSNVTIYNTQTVNSNITTLNTLTFSNSTGSIYLDSSNTNIGIDYPTPEYKLDVNGDIRAVSYYLFSDIRKKKDIQLIDHAIDKLSNISGYTFTLNGQRSAGLIAQEVLPVLPEVISQDSEGYLNISYDNMIGLLVNAVKELTTRVQTLEHRQSS